MVGPYTPTLDTGLEFVPSLGVTVLCPFSHHTQKVHHVFDPWGGKYSYLILPISEYRNERRRPSERKTLRTLPYRQTRVHQTLNVLINPADGPTCDLPLGGQSPHLRLTRSTGRRPYFRVPIGRMGLGREHRVFSTDVGRDLTTRSTDS